MQLVRRVVLFSAATLLFACHKETPPGQSLTGSGSFEGTITVRNEDPPKPVATITYEIKGAKFRVNLPEETNKGRKGFVLFDTEAKKTELVLDDQKAFVTINLGAANVTSVLPQLDSSAKIDQAGKVENVAGFDCEDWTITSDSGKTDLCVVKGVPWFSFGSGPPSADQPAWMSEMTSGKYFPLRIVTVNKDGSPKKKMEATKIDRTSIADARLQVPPDYKEIDMKELLMPAAMSAVPLHPNP